MSMSVNFSLLRINNNVKNINGYLDQVAIFLVNYSVNSNKNSTFAGTISISFPKNDVNYLRSHIAEMPKYQTLEKNSDFYLTTNTVSPSSSICISLIAY